MKPVITSVATVICILAIFSYPALGDPLYVPSLSYPTIQDGIDAAAVGDIVLVADGIHTGPGNKNLEFYGKAIPVRSLNGPLNCIIDCEFTGNGFIFNWGEGPDSLVSGFTIIHGMSWSGGGISCYSSSPTIDDCIISGNAAGSGGGGGIGCYDESSPTITNCTISGNEAVGGDGGGILIYNNYPSFYFPTITDCTISNNDSDSYGGGISTFGNTFVAVTNCSISGNSAKGGGGIDSGLSSKVWITDCTISDNIAESGGGGIYNESFVAIANCLVSQNTAYAGGGIECSAGEIQAQNSMIIDNLAHLRGGGIYTVGSDLNIVYSTIAGNVAEDSGGGIFDSVASNLIMLNSILWANSAPYAPGIYPPDAPWDITYSDIQMEDPGDFWPGVGNINEDPAFAGPGNYHLELGSPCIDTGIFAGIHTDIDGEPRPLGSSFEMGADEYPDCIIPLELLDVPAQNCDEEWTEAGVILSIVQTTADDCDGGGNCFFGVDSDRVWLYPARLHLDFSDLDDPIIAAAVDVHDGCGNGCTKAFLYEGASTLDVASNYGTGDDTLILYSWGSLDADSMAVSSCEGAVIRIRLYCKLACSDYDQDGYSPEGGECGPADCDDTNPDVNPGAEEVCDQIDNDCDDEIDEDFDQDGDDYTTCEYEPVPDCDDTDPEVNPGHPEIPDNGKDDDCDGIVDEPPCPVRIVPISQSPFAFYLIPVLVLVFIGKRFFAK